MDEFIKSLSSPAWWIGVVAVGVILNVVSTYLKSGIEGVANMLIHRWRVLSDKNEAAKIVILTRIRQNAKFRRFMHETETRKRLSAIHYSLYALCIFALGVMLATSPDLAEFKTWAKAVYLFAAIVAFFGVEASIDAVNVNRALVDAQKNELDETGGVT
jgi:hypothetical protein